MDADLIVYRPISEELVEEIKQKSVFEQMINYSIRRSNLPQNDTRASANRMVKGVNALKINFTDVKTKNISIRMTADGQSLAYRRLESERTCWEKVSGDRILPLS